MKLFRKPISEILYKVGALGLVMTGIIFVVMAIYVTYKEMTGSFKVMATKEIMKETPLPTEQPNYLLPNLSVPQYTPAIDEKETSASEDITLQEGLKTQEPESVEMQEGLGTPEPECTVAPEETKALEPVCTITPVADTKDSEQMVTVPTLNPSQEENLELGKTDTTPPKTNIQNKT